MNSTETQGSKEKREKHKMRKKAVQKQSPKRPFYKRRSLRVMCVLLITFCLLITFVAPLGLKFYLSNWLKKNGADSVTIEKLGWNPFVGRFWLDGVDLSRKGKPLLKQAGLDIQIDFKELIHKNIKISSITYRGLFLELERLEKGGWEIATLSVPSGKNGGEEGKEERTVIAHSDDTRTAIKGENAEGDPRPVSWAFLADNVRFQDCQVHYKSPILDIMAKLDSAGIDHFSTRSESDGGRVFLRGSANDAVFHIDLNAVNVTPDLRLAGKVNIKNFNLDELDTILKNSLPYFGGLASIDGDVDFSMGKKGIDVRYDGIIDLQKGDVGSVSFRTKAERLTYEGVVYYAMPLKRPMFVKTEGVLQANNYFLQVPTANLNTSESLVKLSGKTTVSIGNGVVVDTNSKLDIDDIEFKMPMLYTTSKNLRWHGKVIYDLARHNLVDTDGALKLDTIYYAMDDLGMAVANERFNWQGKVLYQGKRKGENNAVECDGAMTLDPVAFEIGEKNNKVKVSNSKMAYKGNFHFSQQSQKGTQGGNNKFTFDGILTEDEVNVFLESVGVEIQQQGLALRSKSEILLGEEVDIKSGTSLKTGGFTLLTKDKQNEMIPLLKAKSLTLEGVEGKGGSNVTAALLHVEGVIANIEGNMPLQIIAPKIGVKEFSTPDLQNFNIKLLQIDTPSIRSEKSKEDLLNIAEVTLQKINATVEGDALIESFFVKRLNLLPAKKDKATLQLGMARGVDLQWSSTTGFASRFLGFSNVVATVVRDKNGALDFSQRIAGMSNGVVLEKEKIDKAKNKKQKKGDSKQHKVSQKKGEVLDFPVPIAIEELLIDGKSQVAFEDKSMNFPFSSSLIIEKLRLGALNSKRAQVRTPIELVGEFEKRAPLRIHGYIQPFLKDTGATLKIELKNYPLKNVSPYVVQAIGTGIASGQLLFKSDIELHDNHIKMDNKVVLRKLETKTISKKLSEKLSNQLPIPLDAALALLRDSDENITLKVPLEGQFDDLHIGLSDTIVTVLGKAVVPALSGYAVYALGPYGALAYVGMKMGEDLLKEGSTPIIFMQGATELVDEQKTELGKVAAKMKDSEHDMQVCPIVASWEFMTKEQIESFRGTTIAIVEQDRIRLNALGQTRAQLVQDFLVQNYDIDKNRLLLCTTVIKEDKKMLPLVVIQK